MMRSMYSAVSGLKTHQTKMDVIGNNIANVNTVAFKSSSVTFQDILYQTTSGASGANAATGVGGVNAKQIGLGVSMASTSVSIETAGASETTGNPFDIKLTDNNSTNFFIVNNGSQNLFTRAGSFYVDGSGNLCMSSTGYTVMGWQVDETTNEIRKDTVSALRIMQEKNLTSAPEATTKAVMAGVLDENDSDVQSDAGKIMNLNFYDSLGYQYTARFSVKDTSADGQYTVELTSILDSNNNDLIAGYDAAKIATLFGNSELTITSQGEYTQDSLGEGYTLNADGTITYSKSAEYNTVTTPESNTVTVNGVLYTMDASGSFVDENGTTLDSLYTVTKNTDADGNVTSVTCEIAAQTQTVNIAAAEPKVINVDGTDYTWNPDASTFQDAGGVDLDQATYNVSYDATANTVTYTLPADPTNPITVDVALSPVTINVDGTEYTWDATNNVFVDKNDQRLDEAEYNVIYDNANNTVTYTVPATVYTENVTRVEETTTVDIDGVIYTLDSATNTFAAADGTTLTDPPYTYDATTGIMDYEETINYTFDYDTNTFVGDNDSKTVKNLKQMFGVSDAKMNSLETDPDYSIKFENNTYIIEEKSATYTLKFNTADGTFESVDNGDAVTLRLGDAIGAGNFNVNGNFENISIDFTQCLNYNNSGKSTIGMDSGDVDGTTGKGRKLGNMIGVSIDTNGKIYGSYDNGNTELLGQIAVAQFSNASGLEKVGESCYQTTLNSGDFDGIGIEVSADGSSMTTGELEMSNVDLSTEFTQMITTQRGFQANSRVITTSDTLLEELVNLKR